MRATGHARANERVMNTDTLTPPSPTRTRVLVAEDNESARTALVLLLQHHGYDVTVTSDGQAAFKVLLGSDAPQIALLDWELPHLDGLHVCSAVRSMPHRPYTYIVMVTARDRPEDVLAAFSAGVDDFLSKPVDIAQVLARLRCGKRVIALEEHCAKRIGDLKKAHDEVRQLKRLLPICMCCKKVRNDGAYWQEIAVYAREQNRDNLSYGICPSCLDSVLTGEMSDDPVARIEHQSRQL